jgi:hypothetical protein
MWLLYNKNVIAQRNATIEAGMIYDLKMTETRPRRKATFIMQQFRYQSKTIHLISIRSFAYANRLFLDSSIILGINPCNFKLTISYTEVLHIYTHIYTLVTFTR